jgi:hypothetical protein
LRDDDARAGEEGGDPIHGILMSTRVHNFERRPQRPNALAQLQGLLKMASGASFRHALVSCSVR